MFDLDEVQNKRLIARMSLLCLMTVSELFKDFADGAGADGTSTFTDGELGSLFHSDWVNEFNGQFNIITRHNHVDASWESNNTSDIGGTEVELRTVVA